MIVNENGDSNHRSIIQRNLLMLFFQNQVKIYEIFNLEKQYDEL